MQLMHDYFTMCSWFFPAFRLLPPAHYQQINIPNRSKSYHQPKPPSAQYIQKRRSTPYQFSLDPTDDLWISQYTAYNSCHAPGGLIPTAHLLQPQPVSWIWGKGEEEREGEEKQCPMPLWSSGCLSHYILGDSCMLMCTRCRGQQTLNKEPLLSG